MELEAAGSQLAHQGFSQLEPIDPRNARFPCCIVWTPLPVISWFIPLVGHTGICREDGVILDFAGPNFVCVDNFAFGAAARYFQIDIEKVFPGKELHLTWDEALRRGTLEFQHRSYNLFTCNCHSFVAHCLNRMRYSGHGNWNVVTLAAYIFLKATWVSKGAVIRSLLPFFVIVCLGLAFGGAMSLVALVSSWIALVGWFVIGTYCFKDLIQL